MPCDKRYSELATQPVGSVVVLIEVMHGALCHKCRLLMSNGWRSPRRDHDVSARVDFMVDSQAVVDAFNAHDLDAIMRVLRRRLLRRHAARTGTVGAALRWQRRLLDRPVGDTLQLARCTFTYGDDRHWISGNMVFSRHGRLPAPLPMEWPSKSEVAITTSFETVRSSGRTPTGKSSKSCGQVSPNPSFERRAFPTRDVA